jgi:hypothetical protein
MPEQCLLDPLVADRLAKLCGMLGSAYAGERASAALMADKLVRSLGLTWFQVILPRQAPRPEPRRYEWSIREKLDYLREQQLDSLTAWERKFILSMSGRRRPSEKQTAVINRLFDKWGPPPC